MAEKKETELRIRGGRFSYANVFVPKMAPKATKAKYSTAYLLPKKLKAQVAEVRLAIEAAITEGVAKKWKGKKPPKLKLPLRDGDEERPDDPEYAGMWFFNATSDYAPGVAKKEDGMLVKITDQTEFYSGCYGDIHVNFYAFDADGGRGVGAGLNHVLKLEDGDPLSGRGSAEDAFNDDDDLM